MSEQEPERDIEPPLAFNASTFVDGIVGKDPSEVDFAGLSDADLHEVTEELGRRDLANISAINAANQSAHDASTSKQRAEATERVDALRAEVSTSRVANLYAEAARLDDERLRKRTTATVAASQASLSGGSSDDALREAEQLVADTRALSEGVTDEAARMADARRQAEKLLGEAQRRDVWRN